MQEVELHSAISSAFREVEYPGKARLVAHQCEECSELDEAFRDKDPATMLPSTVERHWGDLPLLTPESFHYFLPAYLRCAINEPTSLVAEFLLYSLIPGKSEEFFRARFDLFSGAQRDVVYRVIEVIEAADVDRDFCNAYGVAKSCWEATEPATVMNSVKPAR